MTNRPLTDIDNLIEAIIKMIPSDWKFIEPVKGEWPAEDCRFLSDEARLDVYKSLPVPASFYIGNSVFKMGIQVINETAGFTRVFGDAEVSIEDELFSDLSPMIIVFSSFFANDLNLLRMHTVSDIYELVEQADAVFEVDREEVVKNTISVLIETCTKTYNEVLQKHGDSMSLHALLHQMAEDMGFSLN